MVRGYSFISIINIFISQAMCLSVFLDRAKITGKYMLRYLLFGVLLVFLIPLFHLDEIFVTFIIALYICNFYFQSNCVKTIWANAIGIITIYCVGTFSNLFYLNDFSHYSVSWLGNKYFFNIHTTIDVVMICLLVKKSNLHQKLKYELKKMSIRKTALLISIGFIFIYFIVFLNLLLHHHLNKYYEQSLFIGSCIACAFIAIILCIRQEKSQLFYKWSTRCMSEQLERQLMYCKKLEKLNQEARAIRHDIHNHMIIIRRLAQRGEIDKLENYVEKIERTVARLDYVVHTGNTIVDAILNEKLQIAEEKKIQITYDVSLTNNLDLDDMDLCIIFANSLDNAIEACEKIENEEMRRIKLKAVCDRGYFFYRIKNTTSGPVNVVGKTILTNKKDSVNHGFGLKNIRKIVERHHGLFQIISEDMEFQLEIDIPIANDCKEFTKEPYSIN